MTNNDDSYIVSRVQEEGYIIMFTWNEGDRADHFPKVERGEMGIASVNEACKIAKKFAEETKGRTRNIEVVAHSSLSDISTPLE
jgi:hypothetical protein